MGREYIEGELRSERPQPYAYHIECRDESFTKEGDTLYRNGTVVRRTIDKDTGRELTCETIKVNHARVMYDESYIVLSKRE